MKRYLRTLGLGLSLLLLSVTAYAAAGDDSLVSLSHLKTAFFPQAVQAGEEAAGQAMQKTYDAARAELDAIHDQSSGGQSAGLHSATLQARACADGQTITLPTGSSFLMLLGSAQVEHSGAVVDVTEGAEVPSGGALLANHRYLVGEETSAAVTVLSGYAQMGVQGSYAVSGGKANPMPFYDVSRNDWFYTQVGYAYEHGLFSGLEEHRFGPEAPMTRAMLMTVLYRMAGAPEGELNSARANLSDVPDGEWFAPYVRWAVAQGIASGTGENTFSPNQQITREQLVVLLYSFASNYLDKSLGAGADLSGYRDLGQVSPWAGQALAWAVGQGIVTSSSSTQLTLSPLRSASRAEVSAMLRAFQEKI